MRATLHEKLRMAMEAARRGERVLFVSPTPEASRRALEAAGRPSSPDRIEFNGGGWVEFSSSKILEKR